LHVLHDLAPEFGLTLHIAHFNHELRGKESDVDARLVAELADRLQIRADFGTGDVGAMAASAHRSLEAVAHDMRWAFLEAVRRRQGAYAVATGHTADDQAETVLMHLLRGAGLRGLAGMAPLGPTVRRPLLATRHDACVSWCREHGVHWREDSSNAEVFCRRNAVRLDVLPFLRRYNPAIDAALTGMAEAVQVDLAYLDTRAVDALHALVRRADSGVEHLALAGYLALPEAIRRQVLLNWLGPNSRRVQVTSVDALLRTGHAGDAVALPGNRQVVKRYDDAILEARTLPPRLPVRQLRIARRLGVRVVEDPARAGDGALAARAELEPVPVDTGAVRTEAALLQPTGVGRLRDRASQRRAGADVPPDVPRRRAKTGQEVHRRRRCAQGERCDGDTWEQAPHLEQLA